MNDYTEDQIKHFCVTLANRIKSDHGLFAGIANRDERLRRRIEAVWDALVDSDPDLADIPVSYVADTVRVWLHRTRRERYHSK